MRDSYDRRMPLVEWVLYTLCELQIENGSVLSTVSRSKVNAQEQKNCLLRQHTNGDISDNWRSRARPKGPNKSRKLRIGADTIAYTAVVELI